MLAFDVILPTIGRNSLRAAVQSIINQQYENWYLTIVHDGAGNDFPEDDRILEIYFRNIPRHNDSGTWARNEAIRRGNAPWIAYIDDDDEWLPNHLATIAKIIQDNPGVNMVRTAGQSFMMKHKSPRSSKLVRKMGPINSTDILTVGMAHTRDLFKQTTGWKPVDNHDHLLWREMLAAGGKAIESDAVTFYFRR